VIPAQVTSEGIYGIIDVWRIIKVAIFLLLLCMLSVWWWLLNLMLSIAIV